MIKTKHGQVLVTKKDLEVYFEFFPNTEYKSIQLLQGKELAEHCFKQSFKREMEEFYIKKIQHPTKIGKSKLGLKGAFSFEIVGGQFLCQEDADSFEKMAQEKIESLEAFCETEKEFEELEKKYTEAMNEATEKVTEKK